MFNSTFAIPAVLVSETLPLQYTLITLTAAILLVLLFLLYQVSGNRRQVTDIHEKLSKRLSQATAFDAGSAVAPAGMPSLSGEADDHELLAVLTAAVAAYEADIKSSEPTVIAYSDSETDILVTDSLTGREHKWDAPTTAGFRVRSIKRVS